MSEIFLRDTYVMDGVRKTSDGYLTAFARVARTGIQMYRGHELGRPDLDVVRVYRPPEEVFAPDAMHSLAHRPVTLRHPSRPVTAKNWKQYAGGQTGGEVVRDGDAVRVPMVLMDQALIDAYEKDGIDQLSLGYSTEIKWRTGVTDAGEHYDAVQTAIRGNHLAMVPLARGGDKLRIGDNNIEDAGSTCPKCGSTMHDGKCPKCNYTQDGDMNMKTLIIDGLTVTVGDDQSGGIIERHIATLMKQLSDANSNFDDFKKKKEKTDKDLEDALKLVQTKDGEIAVLNQKIKDSAITPEKLDVMVKDRLAVVDKAKTLLGDKYVFDGKTVETIRKDAVAVKLGDAAAAMTDGVIEGAFAALTVDVKQGNAATQIGDALRHRPHSTVQTTRQVSDAAYDGMVKGLGDAWKTPNAA